MSRSGAAAAACTACLVATATAAANWTPPLLPVIARQAASAKLPVHCLRAGEWSSNALPPGSVAVRRGGSLLVTDHACSVLVGYAASFPHAPRAGTPQEFEVARTLYRFLAGAVAGLHLGRGRSDCRVLESFVPALRTLGAPSKSFANGVRTRLLVARRRLHIEIRPSSDCPVKLPKAAPS